MHPSGLFLCNNKIKYGTMYEIKQVNPRGNQLWIFIGRTDAEAEAPVFWSPDANNQLTGKVLNAGKDWGQKEKRASEDEIAGCHHQCNGHELGHSLGDGDGQGGLMCCSLWGHTELNTTRRLNNSLSEHTAVQMYTHKIWTVWKSKKIH